MHSSPSLTGSLFAGRAVSPEMRAALCNLGRPSGDQLWRDAAEHVQSTGGIALAIYVRPRDAFAENNPDRANWVQALDTELRALFEPQDEEGPVLATCNVNEATSHDDVLPALLLLNRKSDGRFKARIVACGNFQSLQASDAYSSVASHDVWPPLLVLVLLLGGHGAHIDICTAFLQTDPDDGEIRTGCGDSRRTFLRPPKYTAAAGVLWRLLRSIYGLRSASAAWKRTLTKWLLAQGFRKCQYDDDVFVRSTTTLIIVVLYVDDLFVLGMLRSDLELFLTDLRSRFQTTKPDWIDETSTENPLENLGHQIWLDGDYLKISQEKYWRTVEERFGSELPDRACALNPEHFKSEFFKDSAELDASARTKFLSVLGTISFGVGHSRPDKVSACAILAEGQAHPTEKHLSEARNLLRVCIDTADWHLCYLIKGTGGSARLQDTVPLRPQFDANFCHERARQGYVMRILDCAVAWRSIRQGPVTQATAEAELISASWTARAAIGFRNLLLEIFPDLSVTIEMEGDNQAANLIAMCQASVRKVRHLALASLYVRTVTEEGLARIRYIDSERNGSDILTKVLSDKRTLELLNYLSLCKS